MDDFLSKPVRPVELQAVLDRWLGGGTFPPEAPVTDGAAALPAVLDHDRLGELRQLDGEDGWSLLEELFEAFLADAGTQLPELDHALARRDGPPSSKPPTGSRGRPPASAPPPRPSYSVSWKRLAGPASWTPEGTCSPPSSPSSSG